MTHRDILFRLREKELVSATSLLSFFNQKSFQSLFRFLIENAHHDQEIFSLLLKKSSLNENIGS